MSLTIGPIREALADVLADALNRRANVSPVIRSNPNLPYVHVAPNPDYVSYHDAFSGGLGSLNFRIQVYVSWDEQGQRLLDEFLSAGGAELSIPDALEAARPVNGGTGLAGLVSDMKILNARFGGAVAVSATDPPTMAYAAAVDLVVYLPRGA